MMRARDDQIAAAIVRQLNDGVKKLDEGTAQRLAASRRAALARTVTAPRAGLTPVPAAVFAATRAVGHTLFNWRYALRYALPLAAILMYAGGIGYWHQRMLTQSSRIAEIDTGLLTDDLPIGAYLDKNFTAWLKRSQR